MTDNKFAILPAEAIYDNRLTNAQLRTLAIICYYGAQKNNGCWPSYSEIALRLDVSRRIVIGNVKILCDIGYIIKESRTRENGSSTSNRYRANYEINCPNSMLTFPISSGENNIMVGSEEKIIGVVSTSVPPIEQENLNRKKNNKNIEKISIGAWQEKNGVLSVAHMQSWCEEKKISRAHCEKLIEEFRDKVQAGGNKYADFGAAFKTWLRNGYLSMTLEATQNASKKVVQDVTFFDRGMSL